MSAATEAPVATPRMLSTAHAAVYLDCSPDHVARLIADGRLPYVNISRGLRPKLRIPVAALERYIERNLTVAETPERDRASA